MICGLFRVGLIVALFMSVSPSPTKAAVVFTISPASHIVHDADTLRFEVRLLPHNNNVLFSIEFSVWNEFQLTSVSSNGESCTISPGGPVQTIRCQYDPTTWAVGTLATLDVATYVLAEKCQSRILQERAVARFSDATISTDSSIITMTDSCLRKSYLPLVHSLN